MSVAALAIRECGLPGELRSEARKEGRMPLQTKDRAPLAEPTMACHRPLKGALCAEMCPAPRFVQVTISFARHFEIERTELDSAHERSSSSSCRNTLDQPVRFFELRRAN